MSVATGTRVGPYEIVAMIRKSPGAIPTRIDLVLNWFGELARRAAK